MDEEVENAQSDAMESLGFAIELAVLSVVAERLASIREGDTYADARRWQSEDTSKIRKMVDKARDMAIAQASKAIDAAGKACDEWAAEYYAARGVKQKPASEDTFLSQSLKSGRNAIAKRLVEAFRPDVMWIADPSGELKPFSDAYKSIVDMAIREVGTKPYESVLTSAAHEMAKQGVRLVYSDGTRRELYSAVSQDVMDGFRQTYQAVADQQAQQFGADGYEVSAHGLCAEDHLPYQGKQYTKQEFEDIQAGLRRKIGKGRNCRHMVSGIVLGVSSKKYTTKQLQEMRKASTRKTGVKNAKGKDLTAYEFSQWQRRQETEIRKMKLDAAVMEKAGRTEEAKAVRKAAQERLARYRELSKKAGVETREERTRVYDIKL